MTDDHALDTPQPRRKAYSYLRFSTPEQSKGNSFARQMAMAEAYADRHGLELDRELTFHDIGVSAYRGQNADAGRLAYFVEAVRSGQVPQGSILLVEQLDRISRLTPLRALDVLRGIINEGVGVVTLNDGKEYTRESLELLPMDLIVSILTFTRANEESATKAKRLKAAWDGKRAKIAITPLTAKAPAWLRLSKDRQRYEVIADRAILVERMFLMTLDGVGQHKIAATFNKEQHAPWGRGKMWHRSYIAKTLANEAVVGRFQPHAVDFDGARKRRVPVGQAVEGYFPPIVDEETFQEAQALRLTRCAPQRGRHAHKPVSNILAGLATCSLCGSTMTRVNKGMRGTPTFVCSRAKAGGDCRYHSIRYDHVEHAVLRHLPVRLEALEGAGTDAEFDRIIRGADERVDRLKERAADCADSILRAHDATGKRSRTLALRLAEIELELEEAEEALRSLTEREAALTGATIAARVQKALSILREPPGNRTPAEVSLALRRVFDRATFRGCWAPQKPQGRSPSDRSNVWKWVAIDFEWKHGGGCMVPLTGKTKELDDGK